MCRGVHSRICTLRRQLCCIGQGFRKTIVTFLQISYKPQRWSINWIYHQKPTNQAFQRYVCQRKCCEVFTYKSETFHCRRPNGISHCENGEQIPPKHPLPLARRGPPCNTAMPRPTARITPNRSPDSWGTVAHIRRKVPTGYNGTPQMRPENSPFPWTDPQTPLPALSLDLSDLWCQMASRSDPPFFHKALDRPTDTHTHEQTDWPTDHPRKVWWL